MIAASAVLKKLIIAPPQPISAVRRPPLTGRPSSFLAVEHPMSVPVVVSAFLALVVVEVVRRYRARRVEAARRISGGRKALVLHLFQR
jgi:hypothetical protein